MVPKVKEPMVSVVVLSWNTLEETAQCLDNLRKLKYKPYEIIVVDNGSTDGSKDYLESQKDINYVSLPQNTGFTGGQLAAYEVAKGDYLALVNSDAIVAPDWLSTCMAVMRRDKEIGAVGGKAFRWDNPKDVFATDIPFYSYQIVDPEAGYAATATSGQKPHSVDSISGAAVLIRVSAIKEVGYFDNDFFAYYEETDLFARMIRKGYKIWYEPKAHVWHQIARSTKDKPFFYLYQMQRNRALYAIKNFEHLNDFLYAYFKYGPSSWLRYLLSPQNMEAKAYAKASWWNMIHSKSSMDKRKTVQNLGRSYNSQLGHHQLPDDITVIIPCYNYEQYIGEAIDSVLKQTLKPSRIIVIDDGSTDNSRRIIKKYKDKVELISKRNEGVVATKNLGVKLSDTTWTLFLDADDVLTPWYLATLYKKACDEYAGVVYTDMRLFGSTDEDFKAGDFKLSRLLDQNFIHNSALIQTELLKQVGGYKKEMSAGYEDWELYLSLAEDRAKFAYVDKPIFLYRQHSLESRNQLERKEAVALLQVAKNLHPLLYKRRIVTVKLFIKGARTVYHNPELILIIPLAAVAGLLLGIIDYYRGSRNHFANILRTYLHTKRKGKEVPKPFLPENER